MAKRYILRVKEIYRLRAYYWAFHYQQRELAKQMTSTQDAQQIAYVINIHIPAPELLVDGSLLRGQPHRDGTHAALESLRWRLSVQNIELMCVWYWTEENWRDFNRAFQAMPDPITADWLYDYDEEIDALRFIPMLGGKSGGSRGEVGGKSGSSPNLAQETRKRATLLNSSPR